MADESTDNSLEKALAIGVRFFDIEVEKVTTRMWDLISVHARGEDGEFNHSANSDWLFTLIRASLADAEKELHEGELPQVPQIIENITSFGADNCGVMLGVNESVATKLECICEGLKKADITTKFLK